MLHDLRSPGRLGRVSSLFAQKWILCACEIFAPLVLGTVDLTHRGHRQSVSLRLGPRSKLHVPTRHASNSHFLLLSTSYVQETYGVFLEKTPVQSFPTFVVACLEMLTIRGAAIARLTKTMQQGRLL